MKRRGLAAVLAVLMFASCVFAAGGNLPGSGMEGDPYLIEDLADFDEFADVENADKYWDEGVYTKLESDLDLDPNLPGRVIYAKAPIAGYLREEFYWEYGGVLSFNGVFDGNCHIISNMIIEGEDYCGLFGRIGESGKVFDLGLHNVKIEGYDYCGGLCGINSGSIARSYVRGSVSGYLDIYYRNKGGFCGYNSGSISVCYTNSSVSGYSDTGGFCGRNSGSIIYCYANGLVSGDDIGGFCGENSGSITRSYWNIDSSGLGESAGGWGLTDEQMKEADSYYGWGISGPIWNIDEGKGYPRLLWEHAIGSRIYTGFPRVSYYGYGTEDVPFKISTASDLLCLMYRDQDWDKHFVLTNDIDMDRLVFDLPIIGYGSEFSGIFDGGGHAIRNLMIDGTAHCYVGFFSKLSESAEVKNLGFENVEISGEEYVGGSCVGGLCGKNSGRVSDCYVRGSVSGGSRIGALCGYNDGSIIQCYLRGLVNGFSDVGGLCGFNDGSIIQCYVSGLVKGKRDVGGLCGDNSGSISYSYSSASVVAYNTVGGLVGGDGWWRATVYSSFWDIEVSGQLTSTGGIGLTTEEMMQYDVFSNNGWGDLGWKLDAGNDYPHFDWEMTHGDYIVDPQVTMQGDGSIGNPWQISSKEELLQLAQGNYYWDMCYVLMNDIDLKGKVFYKPLIGYSEEDSFVGNFDGNGHLISNFTIETNENAGLFGVLGDDAIVSNLGIEDAVIIAEESSAGGVAGNNYGNIEKCYFSGSVSAKEYAGGLVGNSYGEILSCYSSGSVSGESSVGGLVGRCLDGIISTCYSVCSVDADEYAGGLVGSGRYFYFTNVCNSFWNVEISGQKYSLGGLGFTTEQMQQEYYYSVNNWSGTAWILDDGNDYPRLSWEGRPGTSIAMPEAYFQGEGSKENPWEICNKEDLLEISQGSYYWDKHYVLMADIDLEGEEFSRSLIGYNYGNPFYGSFEGNRHQITNPVIEALEAAAIFGFLSEEASISNLYIINAEMAADGAAGGLTGKNGGVISNCSSTGNVYGRISAGGLVGTNRGIIQNSCSGATVSGLNDTGGLVGDNYEIIRNCYSYGSVFEGYQQTGGLVGYSTDSVSYCYSTASVSKSLDIRGYIGGFVGVGYREIGCFWDIDSSGVGEAGDNNYGAIGVSSAEMQDMNMFIDAGWGISYFEQSGKDWVIREGQYPILSWESYKYDDIKPECDMIVDRVLVKAERSSGSSQDIITIKASIVDIPADVLAGVMSFSIYAGSDMELVHNQTINVDDSNKQVLNIRNGTSKFKFDFDKDTFQYVGKNLDLTGLCSPITVVLENDLCTITGVAYDGGVAGSGDEIDVINGNKSVPLELMVGVEDILTVDKLSYREGKKPGTDKLKVQGQIIVADTSVDIAAEDMVISYGDYSVVLEAEDVYRLGNKKAFKYKKPKGVKSDIVAAMIDLEKCKYTISISKADIGEQGEDADFGISFGEFDR